MKKLTMFLAALILLIGAVTNSNATPLYYTFDGTVTYVQGSTDGLTKDSIVTYTFLVDTEAPGSFTVQGYTYILTDSPGVSDYFLAAYMSGSAISRPPTGNQTYTYQYGFDYITYSGLVGSPTNYYGNYIQVKSFSTSFSDWVSGSILGFTGYDYVDTYSTNGSYSLVISDLKLADISANAPSASVPEPSTMLLLGSGLLGLVGLNRRRKS